MTNEVVGVPGPPGPKGEPGVNSITSITVRQYRIMFGIFWALVVGLIAVMSIPFILFAYPFQAVRFEVPVKVLNTGKKIACNEIIDMEIHYDKIVKTPGLTVMTLGYEHDGLFFPLDSTTVVSDLPPGKGIIFSHYALSSSPVLVGKERRIRFFIYHWIFGFRPVLDKFDSEMFEITACPIQNLGR